VRTGQVIVVDADHRLVSLLSSQAAEHRWALRQPRTEKACRRLLMPSGPTVLVAQVGADPERQLNFVDRVHAEYPHVDIFALVPENAQGLADLAWGLGAVCVLREPWSPRELIDAVDKLLETAVGAG
jgi:hypothetical protein